MTTDQASAIASSNAVLLTFMVGPYRLCSSSERVVGIIAPPPLARLPGSDRCQRGIFFHHGRTALVIGLRCKFGLTHRTRRDTGQLILVEIGNELAGFWVDEVIDAPETQHAVWRDTPPALRDGVFDRLAVLNQDLYLYVDFEKLLYADADEVAAALGTLAPTADKDHADADRNIPPEAKPAIEAVPTPEPTTAATDTIPADVTATTPPVAPRAAVRVISSRAPVGDRTTPRQRASAPIPAQRATALLSNAGMNVSNQTRDWSQYTTSATATSASHGSGTSENRSSDRTLAWVLGAIVFVGLLIPLLWLLLSAPDRAGAKSAGTATKHSAATEMTRAEPASSPVPPASPTTAGEAPAGAGQAEVLKVDTADFVLTVERAEKPGKDSAAAAKPQQATTTPAAGARPQVPPQGPGDWQEITHVVKRGDTLWDIARQYLGNPFRYPELAKLSQIRNPDLIHPGDRVHIKKKVAASR